MLMRTKIHKLLPGKSNERQREAGPIGREPRGLHMERAVDRAKTVSPSAHTTADRARVLLEINNAIVSHLDLGRVLKSVSQCLRREIKHDVASLALYDPERNELRLHALEFPDNA